MAEDALAWVERGFRTMYLKVGFAPDIDEARVRAVRAAIGDGPRIRIDANAAWSPALALRMLPAARRRTASSTPSSRSRPGDPAELARLRARSPVPILAHESSLTLEGTLAVIRCGGADALQLDPALRRRHRGRPHGGRRSPRSAGLPGRDAHVRRDRRRHGADAPAARRAPQLRARQPDVLPQPDRRRHPRRAAARSTARSSPCRPAPGLGVELDRERVAHWAAYYESEVAGRPPQELGDRYYDRDYLIRPHI